MIEFFLVSDDEFQVDAAAQTSKLLAALVEEPPPAWELIPEGPESEAAARGAVVYSLKSPGADPEYPENFVAWIYPRFRNHESVLHSLILACVLAIQSNATIIESPTADAVADPLETLRSALGVSPLTSRAALVRIGDEWQQFEGE